MNLPQRKAARLSGFPYRTPGLYFVTICAYQKAPLLGHLKDGQMALTDIGSYIAKCWCEQTEHYECIYPWSFVVMPNHFHGILEITPVVDPALSLPDIMRNFKALTAHEYYTKSSQRKLWQRGYYDHVIRDDSDLTRIETYITTNPLTWKRDKFYLE